ncbi:MAG TPA: hypothetical protein VHQ65_09230 [Thermoanaerobaculia bacterium]|nr:hypothetical protein [Thermoanaerobaculia bacterium]
MPPRLVEQDASARLRRHLPFLAVVAVLLLWSGWFVYRSSLVSGGERHFVLFDDAMISMTYARNLVEGHGLNWARQGEPVEGFTTPLWTAAMVPANLLGLELRLRSLVMQIAGAALLVALLWAVRRLMLEHFATGPAIGGQPAAASRVGLLAWLPAVVLTAGFEPLAYWALMGMESGLQALLVVLGCHYAFDVAFAGRPRYLALSVVLALAYLVRMDMAIFAAAVLVLVAVRGGFRRQHRRRWIAGLLGIAGVAGGYQLFRWLYFGAPLPNTYYLKLADVPLELRLVRGLDTLGGVVDAQLGALLLVTAVAGWAFPRRDPARAARLAFLVVLVLLYAAYSVWVGGDVWEIDIGQRANRFVAPFVPLVFVLFNAALLTAPRRVATRLAPVATLALLVLANGLWLGEGSKEAWKRVLLVDRPMMVGSHAMVLEELRRLQEVLAPGAEVVTYWAGIPAFFSDYRMIDGLGYSDAHIARRPVPPTTPQALYVPGHAKNDLRYLLERRPDAYFQVWDLRVSRPGNFMRKRGYRRHGNFWLRSDSPYLR